MLPMTGYEMVRRMNEERRERSMRNYWWKHREPVVEPPLAPDSGDADVIELVFGARCDVEEPIGA